MTRFFVKLPLISRLTRFRRRSERGQMLIVMLLVGTLTAVLGVVAVDAGLWQSERRGAQKDVDLAVLAGAHELLAPTAFARDAQTATARYGDLNDEASNGDLIGNVQVDASCFGGGTRLDSVRANIRHHSRVIFGDIFGLRVPDVSAHARACAGSLIQTTGLRPYSMATSCTVFANANPASEPSLSDLADQFASRAYQGRPPTRTPRPTDTPVPPTATRTPTRTPTPSGPTSSPTRTPTATATPGGTCAINNGCFVRSQSNSSQLVPNFGTVCRLDGGAQSTNYAPSNRGQIDLNLTGAICSDNQGGQSDLRNNVQNGSNATCRIGDTVWRQSGQGSDLHQGVEQLLAGQGTPAVADGADCDQRSWGNRDGLDEFGEALQRIDGGPSGPSPTAVYQLRDCQSPRVINIVVVDQWTGSTARVVGFAAFYIMGCYVNTTPTNSSSPNKCTSNALSGQQELWGIFFNMIQLNGDITEFNPYGDNAIALTE